MTLLVNNFLFNKIKHIELSSKQQVTLISLSTIISSLLSLLAIKFIALGLTPEDVASYLLIKRSTPFYVTFILFGIPVALPVFLSKFPFKLNFFKKYILKRTVIIWCFLVFFILFFPKFTTFLTGQTKVNYLLNFAFFSQIVVFSLYAVVFAFFTGLQDFVKLSILQIFGMGICSILGGVLAYLIPSIGASGTIIFTNLPILVFLVFLILTLSNMAKNTPEDTDKEEFNIKEFKQYSGQRLLVDLLIGFFLAIPGILVTNTVNPEIGVVFNFCFVIVGIAMVIINPFTTVFLPKLTIKAQGRTGPENYINVKKYLISAYCFAIGFILFIIPIRKVIMMLFLSDKYFAYDNLLLLGLFSTGGIVLYCVSRLLIDSLCKTPYHIYSIIISIIFFVAGFYLISKEHTDYYFILLSLSFIILGIGSSLSILFISRNRAKKEEVN